MSSEVVGQVPALLTNGSFGPVEPGWHIELFYGGAGPYVVQIGGTSIIL